MNRDMTTSVDRFFLEETDIFSHQRSSENLHVHPSLTFLVDVRRHLSLVPVSSFDHHLVIGNNDSKSLTTCRRTGEAADHSTVPEIANKRFVVRCRRVDYPDDSTGIEQRGGAKRHVERVTDNTDATATLGR